MSSSLSLSPTTRGGGGGVSTIAWCAASGLGVYALVELVTWQRRRRRCRVHGPKVELAPHRTSWIPYLGKALDMSSMPMRDFILKYAAGQPVFTCTIAGDKCLFLANPKLVSLIYRDRPELDFNHLAMRFRKGVLGAKLGQQMQELEKMDKSSYELMHKHFMKRDSLQDRVQVAQLMLLKQVEEGAAGHKDLWPIKVKTVCIL